jgi:molecular chaperone GrpE
VKKKNEKIAKENDNEKVNEECIEEELNKAKEDVQDTDASDEVEECTKEYSDDNSPKLEELQKALDDKEKQCQEYLDMLRRNMADFDNFRKRTSKEKEGMYDEGFADAIKGVLPVIDNLERAVAFDSPEAKGIIQGVEMVLKMFKDTLTGYGVEEINAQGEKFNPDFHNAVAHIEDENYEDNIVVDVLQKGYKYKDKILRYSMVKVAN